MSGSAIDPGMKLLFVHQFLGATGGAETNIRTTARELTRRGNRIAFLHAAATGRDEDGFRSTFSRTVALPDRQKAAATAELIASFNPDLIYLHKLDDLDAMEALIQSPVPVVRMVHDHELYCLRGYKYNPLTRRVCTRPASLYCIFPCMATLARNRHGFFPLKWASYRKRQRELSLSRSCERLVTYSDYCRAELVR